MTALFVVATIVFFLTIDYFVQKKESPAGEKWPLLSIPLQPVAAAAMKMPAAAFLHPGHTWLMLHENGNLRVGIDDFAAEVLGKSQKLDLPSVDSQVKTGDRLLGLQVANRTADFVAPIDGEIVAVNGHIAPEKLPGEWLVEIKPQRFGEQLQSLRIAEVAREWLERERARFKDFLAYFNGDQEPALQDGGEPIPGVLAHANDEIWKAFQEEFLTHGS